MNEIKKSKYFKYKKYCDYTSMSLTDLIFENLNFKNENSIVSFFRCDFRGSSFKNVHFYKNIFDRADFISCTFIDCTFEETDFGRSQIKNCYFENCKLFNNKYNTNTIQISSFKNCKFIDEKIMSNICECSFINVDIIKCDFNRSSIDKISFYICNIKETNLATLHAEQLSFISCSLECIQLGLPYFFGYLFANTSLNKAECLYRGKLVSSQMFKEYAAKLLYENRYAEYWNSFVFLKKLDKLPFVLKEIIIKILSVNNEFYIYNELSNLFEYIIFYIENEIFSYDIIFNILSELYQLDSSKMPKNIELLFLLNLNKILYILQQNNFSEDFYNFSKKYTSVVTFVCNTTDYEIALNSTSELLHKIGNLYNLTDGYFLLDSKKGSWILTFIVISAVALTIPKIFKCYSDIILEFNFKRKLSRKILKLMDSIESVNKIKKITNIAKESKIVTGKEKENISVEDIKKIIESIKIDL